MVPAAGEVRQMKRTVMKIVMATVGAATLALAPSAFASDRHRIPLPHEVLGIPAPHDVILDALNDRGGHSDRNYRDDRRYDYRHDRHHGYRRHEWRDDRRYHHHNSRYDRHDRRHDHRDHRGRGHRH